MTAYYRTPQGSHRHTTWGCARSHQVVGAPEPFRIPDAEAAGWAPCADCCDASEISAHTAAQESTPALCRNSGVKNPRRMRSTCNDCGKEGAVNRSTSTLRAHVPAN
jgi:hypothetical protein